MPRRMILAAALAVLLSVSLAPSAMAGEETPPPARAAGDEDEIAQLKTLVKQLEERIQNLEQKKDEEKTVTVEEAQKSQQEIEKLKKNQKANDKRLMGMERETALDRVRFTGDYRFEAHSINASIPAHFDGMQLQNLMVNTLFYYGRTGQFPQQLADVENYIGQNYGDYLYYTKNLSFADLRNTVGQFPAQQQQALFQFLMPSTRRPAVNGDNNILYTNRLRLQMDAQVGENVSFTGRLAMYKVWGDSTGVQVFNGQPNSVSLDGNTAGVPNSDILRVERGFFTWNHIGGAPLYLSIGRRPSTGGLPLSYRQDELRGGTPSGSVIDYQFDGITVGYHFGEHDTLRLCYGLGYESGFGSGELLKLPQDRLKDAHFLGVNWDVWQSDRMFLQATVARAFNVTDGFNGLVVLPNNPVTGEEIGAPLVMRFTPSTNLGNINLASVVFTRKDGPFDWFVSGNLVSSDPNGAVTPFGGLFSDPFEQPQKRNGAMIYSGFRWVDSQEKTKLGFEFNHGSKYWFNFALAEDDLITPKTSTRGDVYEAYMTHRIRERFILKVDFIRYNYDYSGSGWHLGAPQRLDSMPLLGFPTYDSANKVSAAMIVRF